MEQLFVNADLGFILAIKGFLTGVVEHTKEAAGAMISCCDSCDTSNARSESTTEDKKLDLEPETGYILIHPNMHIIVEPCSVFVVIVVTETLLQPQALQIKVQCTVCARV